MKAAVASALSGLSWGLLGAYVTRQVTGGFSWYWYAAPSGILIGLVVFYFSRWTYRRPLWVLMPAAFISTFVAVGLFGLCLGFADLMRDIPNRTGWAVVVQGMNACWWGLVFLPPLWLLFLLSFGNHALLRYWVRVDAKPAGRPEQAERRSGNT